ESTFPCGNQDLVCHFGSADLPNKQGRIDLLAVQHQFDLPASKLKQFLEGEYPSSGQRGLVPRVNFQGLEFCQRLLPQRALAIADRVDLIIVKYDVMSIGREL